MDARLELDLLRQEFVLLETDAERKKFNVKFKGIYNSKDEEEKEKFKQAFIEGAKEAGERAERLCKKVEIWLKLKKIKDVVSISYIAEHYFKKSSSWFSERLSFNKGNGASVSFTEEELTILSKALDEIGDELKEAAHSL